MSAVPEPFRLIDCSLLIRSMGKSAQSLRELRDHLAVVPAQCISHHYYDSLLRPTFDHPEYRNDFARWVGRNLRDTVLAERLGVTDPIDFPDLEHLRQHLIDLIEDRLAEVSDAPLAPRGGEFHFLCSQFVIVDTHLRARKPAELGAMIPHMSTGSIFFHVVEASRRPPIRKDDFSTWLVEWGDDHAPIRERLEAIDYSMWSLTELRDRIAGCFDEEPKGRRAR